MKDGIFEPLNFLREMSVDQCDMIGGADHAAFGFGDIDASIEAEQRRAPFVRCKRSGRPYQRGHDEQRKNNRDDRGVSAFMVRVDFRRRCGHDVALLYR